MPKIAFLGLDYIIDIMHPSGKIARSAIQAAQRQIVPKANNVLEIAAKKNWLKILVKVGFSPDYLDQPKQSPMFGKAQELEALMLGAEGTEFHPDLNCGGCYIITKPRVSAFYGTNLDGLLRTNKIEHLLIGGVSTAWAVQSAVRDAHDRDYRVSIIEDICAAADEQEHDSSIELMSRIAEIITVDDLLNL